MAEEPNTEAGAGDPGSGGVTGDEGTVITDGVKPESKEALRSTQEAGEEKTAEEKAAEEKAAEEKGESEGAPETYKDFTLPEGAEVDGEAMTEFQALSKELDLSQGQAQKLIDYQVKFVEGQNAKNVEVWKTMKTGWLTDSKADDEIGGQKFDGSVDSAKLALNTFGTPALVELLETYGLGNHPEIIRYSARVGEAIGEDKIVSGGSKGAEKTTAQRIFTTSPSA